MARDEWFRSPRWDPEEHRQFEAKLARARPRSRPQYLRLKGLALAGARDDAACAGARQLFERVIDSGDQLQAPMAKADLARWFEQAGMVHEAAGAYRACLQAEDSLGGSLRSGIELDLAELIVREGQEFHYEEAFKLLDRAEGIGLTFEVERWRHAVASARLHARRGRHDEHEGRTAAVDLLDTSSPDFSRHPGVGRIKANKNTVTEMRTLAE